MNGGPSSAEERVICPRCGGSGGIRGGCASCDGTGWVQTSKLPSIVWRQGIPEVASKTLEQQVDKLIDAHPNRQSKITPPVAKSEFRGGHKSTICTHCGGQGRVGGDACPRCHDSGSEPSAVEYLKASDFMSLLGWDVKPQPQFGTCIHCGGKGRVKRQVCSSCGGSGVHMWTPR